MNRKWYDHLVSLDRRIIYLIMAAAVLLPIFVKFPPSTGISREVRDVYQFVEQLKPGDNLFISVDFDPSTMAELQPMTEAIMGQAFDRGARIVVCTLSQFAPAMTQEIVERVGAAHGKEKNKDWVFLGYKPYPAITILAMGTNFRVPFPADHYGTRIAEIPMMRDIQNFDDVTAVISLAAGNVADFWITYGQAKYGVKLALGVTGVMASDYYPYLQSGQVFGLIPGTKGAAEYEALAGQPGQGSRFMPFQMTTHFVILAFMVLSNIGYIAQRRARNAALQR